MKTPVGWKLKKIEDIYNVIGGGTPSTKVENYWEGEIPWITSADIHGIKDIKPRRFITKQAINDSATNLVPGGSIIVVTRVALGKVAQTEFPLCFSQDSQALISKSNDVYPPYVLYYLSKAVQSFKYIGRGTTISGVTKKQLKELPIILPPKKEQERIVDRIEELFTQLEAGEASLRRVRAGLKRYKASVLKAACEGRLVDGGNGRRGDGELPEGWRWVTVGEIGIKNEQTVLTGPFGLNLGKRDFLESGIPVLTIGCLTESGLKLDKAKFISSDKAKELERYKVREDDLLFSRMATVGRAGIVTGKFDGTIFNYHLMRLRLDKNTIDPYYFLYYVRGSNSVTNYIKKVNHGATRDGINTEQLLGLPVSLPPKKIQIDIVAEVERRMSVTDQIESAVEAGLKRAERLRQAILKAAFEGRL